MLYTVRYGDSLSSIAEAHRLSPASLSTLNQLDPHIKPVVGQSLIIPDDNKPSRSITVHGRALPGTGDLALMSAAPYLTYTSICSGRFLTDGSIIMPNDRSIIRRAYSFGTAPLLTLTNQREGGEYSGSVLHTLLCDSDAKDTLMDNIINHLSYRDYRGVNIDFARMYPEDTEAYSCFIRKLSDALHERELVLIVTVSGINDTLPAIGGCADSVIILPSGRDHAYCPPAAICPINEMQDVLEHATCVISSNKILMGMPSYGCNWMLPYHGGIARTVYLCEAPTLAFNHFADIRYDDTVQAPHFSYYDSAGNEHIVWFHDPRSISVRLELVEKYGLGGISWGNIAPPYRPGWMCLTEKFDTNKIL